jgi:amino acid adenylation domain-containing protein
VILEDGLGVALLRAARRYSERPALWVLDETLSYRALFERAGALALGLRAQGIEPGERVAILSQRSATLYVGVLGALLAGCTYVPLNPRFPRERNSAIVSDGAVSALVLDARCAGESEGLLRDVASDILVVTPEPGTLVACRRQLGAADLPQCDLKELAAVPRASPEPCYLLFTSGTTGTPKGVPISHANLAAYLPEIHKLVPIGPEDRVLQCVDLTFDLSVHDMFLTWLNGAELYSVPENASIFAPRLIARNALTASLLVPSSGSRALEEGLLQPGSMPTLRYSLFAGEALPTSMVKAWQKAAPNSAVFNLYGPTEGTIHVSYCKIDPGQEVDTAMAVVPIGWPIGAQRMELFDDGRPVPRGETGEIYLSGPQMTRGYWRAPALDAEKFVTIEDTRWYRTGDLGRYVEEHGVLFGGRADRQVKIRGYRVELQEIEGALREASNCGQVAVLAWPFTPEGNAEGCVAFIAGKEQDVARLQRACRTRLPVYMVPGAVFFVTELPLNANGKTDYRALYGHPALNADR